MPACSLIPWLAPSRQHSSLCLEKMPPWYNDVLIDLLAPDQAPFYYVAIIVTHCRVITRFSQFLTENMFEDNDLNLPMQEDNFNVHILSIFVQKVLQEVRHWLVCYVSANDDVSNVAIQLFGDENRLCNSIVDWSCPHRFDGENATKRKRKLNIRFCSRNRTQINQIISANLQTMHSHDWIIRMHHDRIACI